MQQLRMYRKVTKPEPYEINKDFEIIQCTEATIDKWIEAAVGLTKEPWPKEKFVERMLGDHRVDYDHIYIAIEKATGKAAATATSQIDDKHEDCMLHMVSSRDEYRGKGLGRAVCVKVLEQMYNEGVTEMTLKTDEFRVAAICLYLSLGFIPSFIDDTMESRWDGVMKGLGRTSYDALDMYGRLITRSIG